MARRDPDPYSSSIRPNHCHGAAPNSHPPWKLSNQMWDILGESNRRPNPVPAPSRSDAQPIPFAGIADRIPSASKTWDWFSNIPRTVQPSSFHGGSVLLSSRASVCDNRSHIGPSPCSERDPILEGDLLVHVPDRKPYPIASSKLFHGVHEGPDYRKSKGPRLPYDSSRAGKRTDVERGFRPCFRHVPTPKGYETEPKPARYPISHMWRSRDIITQHEPEFAQTPNRHHQSGQEGNRSFPLHHRRSRQQEPFRPARRPLRSPDVDTAARTIQTLALGEDREAKTTAMRTVDKNWSLGSDVINYRFSGGICPTDRKVEGRIESGERDRHELALQHSYRTNVIHTQQQMMENLKRSQRRTQIY
uniref:Uncharacterized protein n=1 Tax=Spongospora subterranea TaxID=70186 RepID=A0A0H5R752_9EUKA|eukprot:CRZ09656.1 hypothetical protein [Spongospora subterranea]